MKKIRLIGLLFSSLIVLSACTNDIIRERVIEIDEKYNVLCAFDPSSNLTNGQEVCTEDTSVMDDFRTIVQGMDAKKLIRESDLIDFTKSMEQQSRLLFTLHVKDSKTAITYHVTAYENGQFQFPEIGTTEMRYITKEKHIDQFEAIKQLVNQSFKK